MTELIAEGFIGSTRRVHAEMCPPLLLEVHMATKQFTLSSHTFILKVTDGSAEERQKALNEYIEQLNEYEAAGVLLHRQAVEMKQYATRLATQG